LLELGLYDQEEDTSVWNFGDVWVDLQWQEQNYTLLQNTENFSGPPPGPTGLELPHPVEPLHYFLKFWPSTTMHRIVVETNRLVPQ
jgi:hypothetical protein